MERRLSRILRIYGISKEESKEKILSLRRPEKRRIYCGWNETEIAVD